MDNARRKNARRGLADMTVRELAQLRLLNEQFLLAENWFTAAPHDGFSTSSSRVLNNRTAGWPCPSA
ncbi:MAG: hypothetical protein WDN30_02295 [Pararobbsia sp.]